MAEMIADITRQHIAAGSADAHCRPHRALREVEVPAAERDVGDDQRNKDTEYCRRDAVEELHSHPRVGLCDVREQHAANGERGEADQEQRPAAPLLGLATDRWRTQCYDR